MKIPSINSIKKTIGYTALATSAFVFPTYSVFAQKTQKDTVELTQHKVSASGTKDSTVLANAPSPIIRIAGKEKTVAAVVDISQNVLYQYDDQGNAVNAFLVASGKQSSPTTKGLRAVTHIETYPYKTAPKQTKRYKNPMDYGPKIICLETVDTLNNARGITGEFIHGNNNPQSIGKYASKGCIRMDNKVIKTLAEQIKRGQFILIK